MAAAGTDRGAPLGERAVTGEPTTGTGPVADQDLEALVDETPHAVPPGWSVTWLDRTGGVALVTGNEQRWQVVVEGQATGWTATVRGRRIDVTVRTRRERMLAAELRVSAATGPVTVKATLPGLVVAVAAQDGAEVEEGASLVTIEAMKMQNEVRAPRRGRVAGVAVAPGRTVRSGEALLRIE